MLHLNITFPEDLKDELDQEAKREHTKRSTLIQKAVKMYLSLKKKKEMEDLLREGYQKMAKEDLAMVKEFEGTLSDGLDE